MEGSDNEQPVRRAVSTPLESMVSKEQFEVLEGKVNDLFDKFYQRQADNDTNGDSLSQLQRKLEHLEGNVIPDLKTRIKTVKKSYVNTISNTGLN